MNIYVWRILITIALTFRISRLNIRVSRTLLSLRSSLCWIWDVKECMVYSLVFISKKDYGCLIYVLMYLSLKLRPYIMQMKVWRLLDVFREGLTKKYRFFSKLVLFPPPTYSGKLFFSSNVFYFLPNSVRFVKKTFFHNFVPLKLKKILNFFLLFQFPSCGMSQTYSKLDTPPTLKVIFYIISGWFWPFCTLYKQNL